MTEELKNTKKFKLYAGVSVVAVIVGGLLVAPSFMDWSKLEALAKAEIIKKTGYTLDIQGDLSLGLLPLPHLEATKVVIIKPVKGHEASPFLKVDSLNIAVELIPLLGGQVNVSSVRLDGPDVRLLTYRDGTDNWKPVLADADKKPEIDQITGAPVDTANDADAQQSISLSHMALKDAHIAIEDEKTGQIQTITIPDLTLKADSLEGPFDVEGRVGVGSVMYTVDASTGGYQDKESMTAQVKIVDDGGRANLSWSGVLATKPKMEAQGELALVFSDVRSLFADMGMATNLPAFKENINLKGMVTAGPDKLLFTNAALTSGDVNLNLKAEVLGIGTPDQSVDVFAETTKIMDFDSILKTATQIKDASTKDTPATTAPTTKQAQAKLDTARLALLPDVISVPRNLNARMRLSVNGVRYNGENTGAISVDAGFANGVGDAKIMIAALPGGGDASLTAKLAGAQSETKGDQLRLLNPSVNANVAATVSSLKKVTADWLKLVPASAFDNIDMPRALSVNGTMVVRGPQAIVTFDPLSLGETKLAGTLRYTNKDKPQLETALKAGILNIAGKNGAGASGASAVSDAGAAAPAKMDIDGIKVPNLPFDLTYDLGVERIQYGSLPIDNAHVAGTFKGQALVISDATAALPDGTFSLKGGVDNLSDLSGLVVDAALQTKNVEALVESLTGKPLSAPVIMGALDATVKAKGKIGALQTDARVQSRGFTASVSGLLGDVGAGALPSDLSVRIQHANLAQALETLVPNYRAANTLRAPLDIAAKLNMSDKIYNVTDINAALGSTQLAGSLKADMSGAKPSVIGEFTSTMLALGDLLGVESKGAKGKNTPTSTTTTIQATPSGSAAQWSRDALNTGWMRSANLDLGVSAKTLTYGAWVLNDVELKTVLKDGDLSVAPLKAQLSDGSLDITVKASAKQDRAPLSVSLKGSADSVDIGDFVKTLMSQQKAVANGKATIQFDGAGSGISSAALVSSIQGTVNVKAVKPTVEGMDIDQIAKNLVEAFDGGWKDVLSSGLTEGFSSGQTQFLDIDHTFKVSEGNMPVEGLTLKTVSGNATLVSSGFVNFARWAMDINNQIQVTQPKDMPVLGMRLYGPLNAPQKTVNSQALESLVQKKLGGQVQKLVGDKLGEKLKDPAISGVINQLAPGLGGLLGTQTPAKTTTPAPAATTPAPVAPSAPAVPTPAPATTGAPAAPIAAPEPTPQVAPAAPQPIAPVAPVAPVDVAPVTPVAPTPAPAVPTEEDPNKKALEGVINQLTQ